MSKTVEADDDGYVHLPPDALGDKRPHAQYEIEREDNVIHLRLAGVEKTTPKSLPPEERAKEFREWVRNLQPKAPILPDEALQRESIYD